MEYKENKIEIKSVLLVVNTSTFFSNLIHVAGFLKKQDIKIIFFFDNYYSRFFEDIETCTQAGYLYNTSFELNKSKRSLEPVKFKLVKRVIAAFYNRFRYTFFYLLYEHIRAFRFFKKILEKNAIDVVILAGDIIQYQTATYIKVARKKSVPTVILPSFMASYKEACEHYFNDPRHNPSFLSRKIIESFFPKWGMLFNGRYLIRLPFFHILVKEIFKVSPPRVWTAHSGYADRIGVESEAIKKYSIREGIPEEQIAVIGSLSNDKIFLNSKLTVSALVPGFDKFVPGRPIALVTVPPDMFQSRRNFVEFSNFDELVKYFITAVCEKDVFNVLVSFHPSIEIEKFKFIEEYGCLIYKQSILDIIPLCDLFISSVSSTIQWAIALAKPVINYDLYKYRYDDYMGVPAVFYAESKDEYEKLLIKFTDAGFLRDKQREQANAAAEWGMIDGNGGERLLKLLHELINNPKT